MSEDMIIVNNLLTIRNHLGVVPTEELLVMYQNPRYFSHFVDSIELLLENDSGFLLFDPSFIDKIFSVFQLHRFDCDSDMKQVLNELIGSLNGIKNYPDSLANILKNNYLAYQEEKRHITFQSTDSLIASLSYDSLVFTGLYRGNLDNIKDGDYFLMSLHYLLSIYPEFFQDERVLSQCLDFINSIDIDCKRFSKRKKYVKEARERVLELKEE